MYTTIKKPSDYFNTKLYTGTGSSNAQTGVGFQPDFTWIKSRNNGSSNNHMLFDAVRGATKYIKSDATSAENTLAETLKSFDSDGFTVGTQGDVNTNSINFASWNWKANGAGVANTDGSISSTVSANTTSGFSIVSYTGTGANATVGHGLGVAPKIVIIKNRDSATNWLVYHASLGNANSLVLNTAGASFSSGDWQSTTPSSSSIYLSGGDAINKASSNQIAYCFADVQGFSKFGSYIGGGSNFPFIYTGFKPAFLMVKNTVASGQSWGMYDNKRAGYNPDTWRLYADTNASETQASASVDFLSNGFKIKSTSDFINGSGNSIIYMAFAEEPLVGDNPATAR